MDERFDMDNNNSIPYGAVNWNNEALASTYAQIEQRERQRLEREAQLHQHTQVPESISQLTELRPDTSNIAFAGQGELSNSRAVDNTTADYTADRVEENVLNFRSPDQEQQRHFSTRLNGMSHNNLNGFSLQPTYSLLSQPNSSAEMQHLQNRERATTGGEFSGCQINAGTQSNDTGVHFAAELESGRFNFNARHNDKHTKRKNVTDIDDEERAPSRKLLITEEKMASRMYNLRISNDHRYATNGLPANTNMMSSLGQTSRSGRSKHHRSSLNRSKQNELSDLEEDEDNKQNNRSSPSFQLAPGIKDALSRSGSFLPDDIFKQIANIQPCFAIVPWKPPLHSAECLNVYNKEQDTDSGENEKVEEEVITNTEPTMELGKFNIGTTLSNNEDDDYFSLDDDMDL